MLPRDLTALPTPSNLAALRLRPFVGPRSPYFPFSGPFSSNICQFSSNPAGNKLWAPIFSPPSEEARRLPDRY
eukprot:1676665-Pleurochrysis_carterae.AAC.1